MKISLIRDNILNIIGAVKVSFIQKFDHLY